MRHAYCGALLRSCFAASILLLVSRANAQTPSVVFSDDFSSNKIDATKYQVDAPFFEGGIGDIHATAHDGVIEFVGTTSQQWWSGGTLRVVPTFPASEEGPVTVAIDRVAEAGVGTASRSALWILDETKTKYVLFADVRGEGGWHYNRLIGEEGDVPTGGGNNIAAFDGDAYDDGGLHRMSIVANGKTVKLLLDGKEGTEVKFPFTKVVVEFGSYARANEDTASTTWDNLEIKAVVPKTTVVFQDDFASNSIDANKYQPDAPFFEGGIGDIHATAHDGVIEFVGTTSQQWWSGGTLRVVPTFAPSESETITLSIDRVAEAGVGTASRSALWILDAETKSKYVLFADVRGEGGWHYNRKIGEDGDVPTGGGNNIAAFDGTTFDDGLLHKMGMIADGKTVKLLLDGIQGDEIKFPFSPVVFELGSYARANEDTASTTWDNLKIESAGGATFAQTAASVRLGQLSPAITVKVPQGLNSQAAVQIKVTSSDPTIAVPDGGTGAELTLTFPAGGANTQTFRVRGVSLGGTQFTLSGAIAGGNRLSVAVISGPGPILQEDFASTTIDATKWKTSQQSFEAGSTGTFEVAAKGGQLDISGVATGDGTLYWPGASLKTVKSYVATKELNLAFEVDRVLIEQPGTAARTGVFITTDDRSKYVFFSQDAGENNWQVNVNPGTPTGNQAAIQAFAAITDTGKHRIRMVADGQTVEVFLDGVSGGRYVFEVTSGIYFELATYARATDDSARGVFDNVKVDGVLPCTAVTPSNVSMTLADSGPTATLTIPQLLNDATAATVTITSRDPKVAVPNGTANGILTLNFAAGAPNTQTFAITPIGLGSTTFDIVSNPDNCTVSTVKVEVVAVPEILLSDDFAGATIDTAKWTLDSNAFDSTTPGTPTAESAITLTNGQARIAVTAESANWPGLALFTTKTYTAGATTPTTFEIDRTALGFVLVTGTGAYERTGVWVKDASGNFILFSENVAHDGRNFGWRYNKQTGAADDNAIGDGVNIPAFDGPKFDDQKNHRMKIVVNGSTAKLFLDDIFGVEIPFASAQGLTFGFGAYVAAATDIVTGLFDNAKISGGSSSVPTPTRLSVSAQGNNLTITWTGGGTLQSADTINGAFTDVAAAASPYTAPIAGTAKFYRVKK